MICIGGCGFGETIDGALQVWVSSLKLVVLDIECGALAHNSTMTATHTYVYKRSRRECIRLYIDWERSCRRNGSDIKADTTTAGRRTHRDTHAQSTLMKNQSPSCPLPNIAANLLIIFGLNCNIVITYMLMNRKQQAGRNSERTGLCTRYSLIRRAFYFIFSSCMVHRKLCRFVFSIVSVCACALKLCKAVSIWNLLSMCNVDDRNTPGKVGATRRAADEVAVTRTRRNGRGTRRRAIEQESIDISC